MDELETADCFCAGDDVLVLTGGVTIVAERVSGSTARVETTQVMVGRRLQSGAEHEQRPQAVCVCGGGVGLEG